MKFPGQRISKHYFPVPSEQRKGIPADDGRHPSWHVVGLDEVLVDMEVQAPDSFFAELDLVAGESVRLADDRFVSVMRRIEQGGFDCRVAPGGTVANSLNNFTFLSGEPAYLLGTIPRLMQAHSPTFQYVSLTPHSLDLQHLVPVDGQVGTAITFVSRSGERSFAVAPGVSPLYSPEDLPEDVVRGAAAAVASLYTLSNPDWPISRATERLMKVGHEAGVPVAFGLGTAGLVQRLRPRVIDLLQRYVTIASMNNREAEALTGESDPLLACQSILEWVDMVIVTEGPRGMTLGGYVDRAYRRLTRKPIRSKAIAEYNRYEFSRLMRREHCQDPCRIYTHIHPYRGGPKRLTNTSGAGDAALAAILHDVSANTYHRTLLPQSAKHPEGARFLTYSSLSRCAQYGNRVAYEVLCGHSPRLAGSVAPDRSEDLKK